MRLKILCRRKKFSRSNGRKFPLLRRKDSVTTEANFRYYGVKFQLVRKNDFRASGSSQFVYDKIDNKTLGIAFMVAEKLKLQSVAFDFVYDANNNPLIIEMSYCFGTKGSNQCKGYWDREFVWHEESFLSMDWMIDNMIS